MTNARRNCNVLPVIGLLAVCGCDGFWSGGSSLGGDTAGDRGNIRLIIINNTNEQAVFTVGTFDPLDQTSQPDVAQFGLEEDETPLPAGETSEITTLQCGRTLGIGSPTLLSLIDENSDADELVDNALIAGIRFYRRDSDGGQANDNAPDNANGNENDNSSGNGNDNTSSNANDNADPFDFEPVLVGSANAFEASLGVDFNCNSIVILRLEPSDVGDAAFRVDFEVVPAESTR